MISLNKKIWCLEEKLDNYLATERKYNLIYDTIIIRLLLSIIIYIR